MTSKRTNDAIEGPAASAVADMPEAPEASEASEGTKAFAAPTVGRTLDGTPGAADEPDVVGVPGAADRPDGPGRSGGKRASSADKLKFAGLIGFFVVVAVVVAALWPYFGVIFEEGGVERLTDDVRSAGLGGVGILLAVQFLQIVVAFIPGEVVQVAAGIIYGPWWGALIVLVGCVISSAFIFLLVHKLGAPFVRDMVPEKYMAKFRRFEQGGKFNAIVFVLFLIPGMPKDIFTYITPLSDMKLGPFLAITNLARIPGVVVSTYAADGLVEGRVWESVVMFAVLAVVAVLALLFYNRIIDALHKTSQK